MSIQPEVRVSELPDTPYNLWLRGELDDFVDAPEGSRIEVIGGQVVVSPPPSFPHNTIVDDITVAVVRARVTDPDFPWRTNQGSGMSLVCIGEGYIPDLVILEAKVYEAARRDEVLRLVPDQVELVVEVTSPSNAVTDRRPSERRADRKWCAYAIAEIPYYLLVDRSPKMPRTTLYSIPDQATGAYLHQESWEFGETIHLPDPFGVDIETTEWRPWRK
ncbi:Uma2 family endonuclease [Spirillospora sp. NPDC052242]